MREGIELQPQPILDIGGSYIAGQGLSFAVKGGHKTARHK